MTAVVLPAVPRVLIAEADMAAQLARLTEHEGIEALAKSRTARLLKIGVPELMRLRKK